MGGLSILSLDRVGRAEPGTITTYSRRKDPSGGLYRIINGI